MAKLFYMLLLFNIYVLINGQDISKLNLKLNFAKPELQEEIYKNVVDFLIESKLSNGLSQLFRDASNSSSETECQKSWNELQASSSDIRTLSFFDSYGKLSSGILLTSFEQTVFFHGEYRECMNTKIGKFGQAYVQIKNPSPSIIPGVLLETITIGFDVCVPTTCYQDELNVLLYKSIQLLKQTISTIPIIPSDIIKGQFIIVNESKALKDDGSAIAAIVILSIIGFIALCGTLIDLTKVAVDYINTSAKDLGLSIRELKFPDNTLIDIILSFSLYTNSKKLFTIKKGGSDQLGCINGIRFLSMSWVVTGHTVFFLITIGNTLKNPKEMFLDYADKFSMLSILNAYFSVDSFFLLSGLLGSYLFIKEVKKKGVSVFFMIKFYIHRFLRITPPYMLSMMFVTCLSGHLISGPYYNKNDGLEPYCKKYWWTNLLYINNIFSNDINAGYNANKACFGHSWYLANDMQFYIISPLMLIPLGLGLKGNTLHSKILTLIGLGLTLLLLLGNFLATFFIMEKNPLEEFGNVGLIQNPDFFGDVYIKPWTRIGPFLIGILYGYALSVFKDNPKYDHLFKKTHYLVTPLNLIGWMLSLALIGTEIFVLHDAHLYKFPPEPWSRASHLWYQATSRPVWAIALGFIIFSCSMGKGGFVNDILSWTVWIPLARLSFSAYLIHMFCCYWYLKSYEGQIYFDTFSMIYMLMGHLFITFVAGYLVSMFFEVPILGIEKIIFGHSRGRNTQRTPLVQPDVNRENYTTHHGNQYPLNQNGTIPSKKATGPDFEIENVSSVEPPPYSKIDESQPISSSNEFFEVTEKDEKLMKTVF